MRRGMQGLALQVQEQLKRDPHTGDLYIFRQPCRGDLTKILWHDGIGLSLYAKRLDRGKLYLALGEGRGRFDLCGGLLDRANQLSQSAAEHGGRRTLVELIKIMGPPFQAAQIARFMIYFAHER